MTKRCHLCWEIKWVFSKNPSCAHWGGIVLLEGNIADTEGSYKYLGSPQANRNTKAAIGKAASTKYLQRIREVLRSQLHAKNKICAINTYTLLVIRYSAGIISLPKEVTRKTRKSLSCMEGFTPNPAS